MAEKITSLQNNKIKQIVKLHKHSERVFQDLFIIEGYREIQMAIKFRFSIETILYCPSLIKNFSPDFLKNLTDKINLIEVTEQVFQKIAYREGSDGLLALAIPKHTKINEIKFNKIPLIIVLEKVEKPGNLGAILRTADAGKIDAVVICDPLTDIYNPNVIRSSLGCVFSKQVVTCTSDEALTFFAKNGISTFAACLQTDTFYHQADFTSPSAIIMGTEATGLSGLWLNKSTHKIKIPMGGIVDSLNVSVSTAIIVFEALRQRGF